MPQIRQPVRRASATLVLLVACAQAQAAGVDLLIKDAQVVDGTGSPWFQSDVAVSDGRIIAMARNLHMHADQTIDAEGRVLAPGFIDVHTHVESSDRREGLVKLPRWAVAGGADAIRERIDDEETHQRIVDGMKVMLDDGGYPDYSFVTVAQFMPQPNYNGRTISEVNRLLERPATVEYEMETILDMMVDGGTAGYSQGASMIYHYMSNEDVDTIFRYPNAAVASDGTIIAHGRGQPHPRSYGTNARVLADFVRKRQGRRCRWQADRCSYRIDRVLHAMISV